MVGSGNPFYGKKHSDLTKQDISDKLSGRKQAGTILENSRKNIKIAKAQAMKNGKSIYDRWINRYGLDKANRLMDSLRKKHSNNSKGSKNSMFGKPCPNGSGNGWACWYKNIHFRSLRELSYYIFEIEEKKLHSRSAQTKDLRIPYINLDGSQRTYTADFFVSEKYLIEIKPKKLWNCKEVQIKKYAAEKFCLNNGYEYKLVDIEPNSLVLREKYLNGEIRFVDKYVDRFEKYAGITNTKNIIDI